MKLFVFASGSMTNIWAGVGAQLWAVRRSGTESTNKGAATKASKMPVGSLGLLYCSASKEFTCPFVVRSPTNREGIVAAGSIWPGPDPYILPFAIRTLGTPHARLSWQDAGKLLPSCIDGVALHDLLHVEPLTVFTGDEISDADWSVVVERLSDKSGQGG